MTYELRAVPKPGVQEKDRPSRKGLKNRKPIKSRNAKRKGSAFPKQRDAAHCSWVVSHTECVGAGRLFTRRVCGYDFHTPDGYLVHVCWGGNDPAHVGKHRAQGVPDLGRVVNMCRALHNFYDEHRSEFAKVTGLTEAKLANIASGNALKYLESGGGSLAPSHPQEHL